MKRIETWIVLSAALAAAGCAHQAAKKADGSQASQGAEDQTATLTPGQPAVETGEAVVRGDEIKAVEELKPVSFAYDSDALSAPTRAVLRGNAEWIKLNPGVKIQVAGYCDQRGTVEYNLALGQRRAKAVRDYYAALGVRGRRIATISYGKEKPLCTEVGEACWLRNRRAESLSTIPQNVSSKK